MFDVGFSELVLIALLALIVLGPKRLPEVARTAGRWLARMRHFVAEVKADVDREMRNAEIMELEKLKQELDETRRLMQDTSSRLMQQIDVQSPAASPTTESQMAKIESPSIAAQPEPLPRAQRAAKKPRAKKRKTASAARARHGRRSRTGKRR